MRVFLLAVVMAAVMTTATVAAHDAPTSFVDLHLLPDGLNVSVTASDTDLAHELPAVEPAMLLDPQVVTRQQEPMAALIRQRLEIAAGGKPLAAELRGAVPIPDKRDLRLDFHYAWAPPPASLQIKIRLFPYDSRHRTFLNIYEGEQLRKQEIFEGDTPAVSFQLGTQQSIGAVVRQFTYEGIHHIFIGPDHILFVVGLLLLGGSLIQLIKIATAFTVAHSITLGLATFHILSPPARFIEPSIALSIVFVGAHALLGTRRHDPRLAFAFCFGLIHGFGFANALQEMMLPRHALSWSLFAFNFGVEIGQLCIILTVAPLLALVQRRSYPAWERTITVGSLCVTAAGAFWFFERVMGD